MLDFAEKRRVKWMIGQRLQGLFARAAPLDRTELTVPAHLLKPAGAVFAGKLAGTANGFPGSFVGSGWLRPFQAPSVAVFVMPQAMAGRLRLSIGGSKHRCRALAASKVVHRRVLAHHDTCIAYHRK